MTKLTNIELTKLGRACYKHFYQRNCKHNDFVFPTQMNSDLPILEQIFRKKKVMKYFCELQNLKELPCHVSKSVSFVSISGTFRNSVIKSIESRHSVVIKTKTKNEMNSNYKNIVRINNDRDNTHTSSLIQLYIYT